MTQSFTYNPAGGIATTATSNALYDYGLPANFTDSYAANGLNQISLLDSVTVTHDPRGNTTGMLGRTYGYDDDNQLVSASGAGITASTLSYDPAGRLKEIASSATTKFLYDGAEAIAEYSSSNALLRRFVPGASADETLVWYEGSGLSSKSWIAADARGSVLAVMNASGAATATNKYDAYGVPAAGNSSFRFGYTGQMYFPEIKLSHYKARAYSPETGRFLQPDPIGTAGGINLYGYVGNDPVNFTDPSGLCTGSLLSNSDGSCLGGGYVAGSGYWSYGSGHQSVEDGGDKLPAGVVSAVCVEGDCDYEYEVGYSGFGAGLFTFFEAGDVGGFAAFDLPAPQNGDFHYRVHDVAFCSADELFAEFSKPGNSAPGAPAATPGTTFDIILTGGNPITQVVDPGARTITNITQEGHRYHSGTVEISIAEAWYGSKVSIEGRGTGPHYLENRLLGHLLFTALAARATIGCTVGGD